MDRDALVRASRRRQALDALVFEQDREAVLAGALEDVVAELAGARLDADLFAQMSPAQAELVRAALGEDARGDEEEHGDEEEQDLEADGELGSRPADEEGADAGEPADGVEAEIARLDGEIESSRRIQAALQRYLELLSAPGGVSGTARESGRGGGTSAART